MADEAKSKRRWDARRWGIILGREKPPPDSATARDGQGGRLEDLLGWIGVKGGKWGAVAVSLGLLAQGMMAMSKSIDKQTEVVGQALLASTKASADLLSDNKDTRAVLVGIKTSQDLSLQAFAGVTQAIYVSMGMRSPVAPKKPSAQPVGRGAP